MVICCFYLQQVSPYSHLAFLRLQILLPIYWYQDESESKYWNTEAQITYIVLKGLARFLSTTWYLNLPSKSSRASPGRRKIDDPLPSVFLSEMNKHDRVVVILL